MKICLLSTDSFFRSDDDIERAISSISFGDQDKENIKNIKNRNALIESLGARVALMRLCGSSEFGAIKKTENGKPYFSKKDAPSFSLSHTKGCSAAALANDNDGYIGIDIEALDTRKNLDNIAKRFFTPDEYSIYQQARTPEVFYAIWTEKESCVKLYGKTLFSEFSQKEESFKKLYFHKYKVKFSEMYAILCVASEREPKEIKFINDEDLEIYELQNRA